MKSLRPPPPNKFAAQTGAGISFAARYILTLILETGVWRLAAGYSCFPFQKREK